MWKTRKLSIMCNKIKVTYLMILIVELLLVELLVIADVADPSTELTDDVDRLRLNGDWNGILP